MTNWLYLRLSTTEEKQKNSFEAQETAILEKYPNLKTEKYRVAKDTVSGSYGVDKRPALAWLLSSLQTGDKVYILALDRLSRDAALCGWLRVEIKTRGVELYSVRENLQDDAQGRLIAAILSAAAEHERDVIRSRISAAIRLKRMRGEKLGGQVPFGYEVEIIDGVKFLRLNAAEQKIKSQILAEYNKTGNYYATAKNLAARNIFGRGGKPISPALVRNLVRLSARSA